MESSRLKKGKETKLELGVGMVEEERGFCRENERHELFQCGEAGKTPLNV